MVAKMIYAAIGFGCLLGFVGVWRVRHWWRLRKAYQALDRAAKYADNVGEWVKNGGSQDDVLP